MYAIRSYYETLITPNELARLAPLDDATAAAILAARREIEAILDGRDPRLLVISYNFV